MYILTKQYNGPLSYSDEYPLYWCDMYIYIYCIYICVCYHCVQKIIHIYIYIQYIYNIYICIDTLIVNHITYYYWYCYLIILYHWCSKPQHRQALAAAARGFNALERREVSIDAWSLVEQPVKQTKRLSFYNYIYMQIYIQFIYIYIYLYL